MPKHHHLCFMLICALTGTSALAGSRGPAAPPPWSEMPAEFHVASGSFDHDTREVMVKMRDGVSLKTFVVVPKGAHDAPILLERTPYDAHGRVHKSWSSRMNAVVSTNYDVAVAAG